MTTMDLPAVLITGSATRIGAEIARGFGKAGWHVVIHHLTSHDEAEALAATLPSAETLSCDLSDETAAVEMIVDLCARLPGFRCLINSASIFHSFSRVSDPEPSQDICDEELLCLVRDSESRSAGGLVGMTETPLAWDPSNDASEEEVS